MEEFMRIRQEETIEEYLDKFEDMRIRLERVMPSLGEPYLLSLFIVRLKDEVRPVVRMLKPTTLAQAFQNTRLQEQFLTSSKKSNPYPKTYNLTYKVNNLVNANSYRSNPPTHNTYSYGPKPPLPDTKFVPNPKLQPIASQSSINQTTSKTISTSSNSIPINSTDTQPTIRQPRSCFKLRLF